MRVFKRFFKEFDMFAALPTLRAKQQPKLSSICAGFLSFVCGLFFIYIFIKSAIEVFNFSKINSTESSSMLKANQTKGSFPMFGITIDNLTTSQMFQMFYFQITYDKSGSPQEIFNLQPCQAQQWKFLGQNYQQKFEEMGLEASICPQVPTGFEFQLKYPSKNQSQSRVIFIIGPCIPFSTYMNVTCVPGKADIYLKNTINTQYLSLISIFIGDSVIIPDSKDVVEYVINADHAQALNHRFCNLVNIRFSSFSIETDVGLSPMQQLVKQSGIMVDDAQTSILDSTQMGYKLYFVTIFSINKKMRTIKRKVGKIDELLSYAGGLFAIIIGFLSIFVSSFNQYRYQLMLAESTFNYDDQGKTVGQNQFSFFVYIKYVIFDWIKTICCFQLKWQNCIQIDETRQQANCQMDITRLFRRIKNIEMGLSFCLDRNQKTVINMLQHPTIHQMKKERLFIDYYHTIIGSGSSITVSDVRLINRTYQLGLKICQKFGNTYQDSSMQTMKRNNLVSPYQFKLTSFSQRQILSYRKIQNSSEKNKIYNDRRTEQKEQVNCFQESVEQVLQNFPQLRVEAESIKLSEELTEIQKQIQQALKQLSKQSRDRLEPKIPIKILFRLLGNNQQTKFNQ